MISRIIPSDLLDWLRDLNPRPKVAFVVHGEPTVAHKFASDIEDELGIIAVVPNYREVVKLDPDDPDEPDMISEGIVVEDSLTREIS